MIPRRHHTRFESMRQPVISRGAFLRRVAWSFITAGGLITFSLAVGMIGYHVTEGMDWIDAFANASMILSGMGPLAPLNNYNGKLFAGLYALYSGLVLVLASGLILAPLLHRILHHFHVESDDERDG